MSSSCEIYLRKIDNSRSSEVIDLTSLQVISDNCDTWMVTYMVYSWVLISNVTFILLQAIVLILRRAKKLEIIEMNHKNSPYS